MKKGWEYKTLGECCDIYNGNSINSDYKMKNFAGRKEGYPFIATKDISFNGIINYDNGIKIPYDSTFKIAYPESVFICAEGGSAGRKIAFVNEKVCFGNKLFCISPHTNSEFIGKYIYYYLNSDYFQKQFQSLLTGLIGGVSAKKFKEITIIKNSIDEQHRIVSYLDSSFDYIDKIKEKASKSLSEAKALFQSALAEAMEPKEGWEEKTFEEICSYHKEQKKERGYKYIGMENIESGTGRLLDYGTTDNVLSSTFFFNKGEVLYGRLRPYLQKVYVAEFEGCCSTEIFPIKTKGILAGFIKYWFLTEEITNKINETSAGCRMPRGNMNEVLKFKLHIPTDIKTQEQIVSRLDSLSSKVRAIEEKYQKMIEECDALKQAMLRDVFE